MTSSFVELRATNDLWEVIVFHDVTAEKLDAALKVARAAAHELRQPLQVIVILLGLVEKELNEHLSPEEHLKTIMECCDRMDHIIQRMAQIMKYQTKKYIEGRMILDIEESSKNNR